MAGHQQRLLRRGGFPDPGSAGKPDEDSGEVSDFLAQEHGIYTRGGGHCAPLMHRALGTERQGAVRFSFSPFNTVEEARQAAAALAEY